MGALIEKEVQLGRKRGNTSTDNSGENQGESRFIMADRHFYACRAKTFPAALSSSKWSALTMKIMFCFHLSLLPMCQNSLLFQLQKVI